VSFGASGDFDVAYKGHQLCSKQGKKRLLIPADGRCSSHRPPRDHSKSSQDSTLFNLMKKVKVVDEDYVISLWDGCYFLTFYNSFVSCCNVRSTAELWVTSRKGDASIVDSRKAR